MSGSVSRSVGEREREGGRDVCGGREGGREREREGEMQKRQCV